MYIPYNQQADPNQYIAQMVSNALGGVLDRYQRKQQGLDVQDIAGELGVRLPQSRTSYGQQLSASLMPRLMNQQLQFPQGLTGPQLDAWGFSPEQWAERNISRVTRPPAKPPVKRPKAIEERWHEAETKTPDIKDKVSEAQSNPDVAAESYRQSLEALGYGDEDIEQLKQIFREGDVEKIRIAIERIGSQ